MEKYGVIYKITNNINGKCYIGQTTSKNGFRGRYSRSGIGIERVYKYHKYHYEKGSKSCNKHLLKAIEKYGFAAFEVVEEFDVAYTKEELDALESKYIEDFDCINNGYNNKEGGSHGKSTEATKLKVSESSKKFWSDNRVRTKRSKLLKRMWHDEEYRKHMELLRSNKNHPMLGKKQSEETKLKISAYAKKRFLNKENHPMYGKHHSEETRKKLSESNRGKRCGADNHNYGKHFSEETRRKLSEAHTGKKLTQEHKDKIGSHFKGNKNPASRKIYVYTIEGEYITSFNTVNECGMWLLNNNYITTTSNNPLPTLRTLISRNIKNNKPYGGFMLSYDFKESA